MQLKDILHVSVPPGDSLSAYHNGKYFSTKDSDNDDSTSDCSHRYEGAWWYGSCYQSNLNGVYGASDYTGPSWGTWKGTQSPLEISRMMIKAND